MNDNPLAKLGDLSKPANTLIKKISEAIGGVFKPYQIVRVAKAEAEVERIHTESQIQVTDLQRRPMHRFLEEEAKRQRNIEAITEKAIPQLEDKSKPQDIQDDWISNFFEKTRIVSDDDMQHLWARLLAGEANAPGSFSKRTVNLIADLDKSDAELFTKLCRFAWYISNIVPLVYDIQNEIYNRYDINFNSLSHLESLGLIQFNSIAGFQQLKLPKTFTTYYYGKTLSLTFPKESDNSLELGYVLLTKAGHELARICGSHPLDEFFEFIESRWTRQSLLPKNETEKGARADHPAPNGPAK